MLAQLQSVPPDFLKSFLLVVVGIIGGAAGLATTWRVLRPKPETRSVSFEPPELTGDFRITPKGRHYSAEACDAKHQTVHQRLDGHDQQIKELWFTLREEDNKTREMLTRAIHEFDKTINRIDGTLSAVDKNTDKVLQMIIDRKGGL